MNEETTIPNETWDYIPPESSSLEVQETDPSLVSEFIEPTVEETDATYFEDLFGEETYEYTMETVAPVTVEVIEAATLDICHSVLFSGFLICGTLVGCALLRKIYGT